MLTAAQAAVKATLSHHERLPTLGLGLSLTSPRYSPARHARPRCPSFTSARLTRRRVPVRAGSSDAAGPTDLGRANKRAVETPSPSLKLPAGNRCWTR